MTRILIVGLGKMGRVHAKHLDEAGIPWSFYDPGVSGSLPHFDYAGFTHAIIATPLETHAACYKLFAGFEGRLLIEKPVVTSYADLDILRDPRVFAGMSERFNPHAIHLKETIDLPRVKAFSAFRSGRFIDVAIHDCDLFTWIYGDVAETPIWPVIASTPCAGIRKIMLGMAVPGYDTQSRSAGAFRIIDLMSPHQTIPDEHKAFFAGEPLNAYASHLLFCSLLKSQRWAPGYSSVRDDA